MIRPPVAGAVPVKVDESSIKDIPGAQGRLGARASSASSPTRNGTRSRRPQKLKVEWSEVDAAVPRAGGALRSHPQGDRAQARATTRRTATSTTRSRPPRRSIEAEYEWPFQSHASMGPACALVEIKDGQVTCWSGSQKSHFVQEASPRTLELPVDKVRAIWVTGPGSYGRNDADDCAMDAAVLAKAVGKPGARCNTCATRAPAGTRKARPRSTARAPRSTPRQSHRLRVHQQGLLARRREHQRRPAARHAGRAFPRRRAEIGRRLRRARPNPMVRQQAHGVGDDPAAARPRLAAAHARICAIRSGRKSTSPANPSWTRWRPRRTSIRSSSGCATSRSRATSR